MTLQAAVDGMTPEKLREWLEAQPKSRRFECWAPHQCVLAEYFKSLGIEVGVGHWVMSGTIAFVAFPIPYAFSPR